MTKSLNDDKSLNAELINWYWRHGRQRVDGFALPKGEWLDSLYCNHRTEQAIALSRIHDRPCFAIWGPSAAGKSTLISTYVESPDDPLGEHSALRWPSGIPARFVVKDPNVETTVLNPYSHGKDASGCVSRFYLTDQVLDPLHPVALRIASPTQIMHAIAMGYVSECSTTTSEGVVYLSGKAITEKIDEIETEQSPDEKGEIDATAYDALHQLVDLLDTLILAGLPRYDNLRFGQAETRRNILECTALLRSPEAVESFATDLLWDQREPLTKMFRKLRDKALDLRRRWGSRPVYCSLPVAALILDIDSYTKLSNEASGGAARVRKLVETLSFEERQGDAEGDEHVVVGLTHPQRMVDSDEDFGIFQGLVLELIVPLRHEAVNQLGPTFSKFLECADLLDFPGVSLGYEKVEQVQINLDSFPPEETSELYTRVLKSGKTASIVASYAKNLTIDGFSLLCRLQDRPAQPGQLTTGIFTWWKYFVGDDSDFDFDGAKEKSPLPLNLVLTFCAKLVNVVMKTGVRDGLNQVFDVLKELHVLSDPEVIWHSLATNYSQFPDGFLQGAEKKQHEAVELIMRDEAFRRQFVTAEGQESFKAMIEDGGTDYVFQVLYEQAQDSRREDLLTKRERRLAATLRDLLSDAVPRGVDELARRRSILQEWSQALKACLADPLREDAAAEVSQLLRLLLDVNPQILDPIPLQLARQRQEDRRAYVDTQLRHWTGSRDRVAAVAKTYSSIGLNDTTQMNHVVRYLAEAADVPRLEKWLVDNFGNLSSHDDARRARRFVAIRLQNEILPLRSASTGHLTETDVRTKLTLFASQEARDGNRHESSPQYQHFLQPFFLHLQALSERPTVKGRPPQPGDDELLQLLTNYPQFQIT